MVAAARGEAQGGPRDDVDYTRRVQDLSTKGQHLDAVLISIQAAQQYDGCRNAPLSESVCSHLRPVLQEALSAEPVVATILSPSGPSTKLPLIDKAERLLPVSRTGMERPDLLDMVTLNDVVEARRNGELPPALQTFYDRAPQLFLETYCAEPYDPARYRDLFNYVQTMPKQDIQTNYTVMIELPAIIDLARALPRRRMPELITSLTRREDRIVQGFPALFP